MQHPPGYMPPGQPNYGPPAQAPAQPGYAPPQVPSQAAPAPGPHYQPPPPAIHPGYPAPVAPPMPGAAPLAPAPGAWQPQGAPGYGAPVQQGAPAYGPPPWQGFSQPGAPGAGFQQGGFRQSGGAVRRFSGADMANVEMSGNNLPFLPEDADYLVQIDRTSQSRRKGTFVAEFTVVWTNSTATRVGARHKWCQGCADLDIALPAIKKFTVSTLGCDSEEQLVGMNHRLEDLYSAITDDENKVSSYPANPLKGQIVAVHVDRHGSAKNPNSPWCRTNFSPAPRQ